MGVQGLIWVAALAWPGRDAQACGGFFCSTLEPVDQSAERIVFGVDDQTGTVTAHIQIFFEGDAQDFAWVVPVPSVPDLFLSTDALFTTLDDAVSPMFGLDRDTSSCTTSYPDAMYSVLAAAESGGGVEVVSEGQVGPYDTAVLRASDEAELLAWLTERGFALPDGLDGALAPYLADGQYVVALRLSKDRDTGEIAPIGLRWAAASVMVPIRLTSIAATPDMRLEVYVLGRARAVPESYLHVVINEAEIDWWTDGSNYETVISRAADEAGGHAFATDWSGATEGLRGRLYPGTGYDLTSFDRTDRQAFMDDLASSGLPSSQIVLNLLQIYMPVPDDYPADQDPSAYYDCVTCYGDPAEPFDADGLLAALDAQVVRPLRDAEDLLWVHDHLTRLTSSLDAVEMTVDPSFVFNEDMVQTVARSRVARMVYDCDGVLPYDVADRTLTLPDGRVYLLPSEQWFAAAGISEYTYLQENLTDVAANIIERTGPDGLPAPMYDRTAEAVAEAAAFSDGVRELLGCGGCAGGGTGGGWAAGLAAAALIRRRRTA